MADTGIQTTAKPTAAPPADKPAVQMRSLRRTGPIWSIVHAVASLRLTVVLFVLSLILVFCGTLAQVDNGIWTVVNTYFRWFYVFIPLQIFFPRTIRVPGSFPFPGGWTIGSVLLINLLAAHAIRFRVGWKRVGIWMIHSGLILLMLGEFFTGVFAVERSMPIRTGTATNYLENARDIELVFVDPSDSEIDQLVAIPAAMLRKQKTIRDDGLPVDVGVERFLVNSELKDLGPNDHNPATAGNALRGYFVSERPEGSGVSQDQREDMASAYLTFRKKDGGESLGTYLLTQWIDRPERIRVNDKTYEVYLRRKRLYTPYSVYLEKFTHEVYPGTDIPKNYESTVHLWDPSRHATRDVRISMNAPLRYEGETFYQIGVLPRDRGTVLQVVRNPSWQLPYYSCALVALGMMIHFGIHLIGFLRRRAA
jgi:hypothetical protein